jgi:hypothetical protein
MKTNAYLSFHQNFLSLKYLNIIDDIWTYLKLFETIQYFQNKYIQHMSDQICQSIIYISLQFHNYLKYSFSQWVRYSLSFCIELTFRLLSATIYYRIHSLKNYCSWWRKHLESTRQLWIYIYRCSNLPFESFYIYRVSFTIVF